MYLARTNISGVFHYSIRQSFFDEKIDQYYYRILFNLGPDPCQFIHQIDEEICFFSEKLEESLSEYTSRDTSDLLEELLWDFIPHEARRRLAYFRNRKTTIRPFTSEDSRQVEQHIHMFDKRRLLYLRYGGTDQSRISGMPLKFFRCLLGQCRDEREFYFMNQERELKPVEYKKYVFTIFNLQQHFRQSYSTFMPESLNQDKIADHFINTICKLNKNQVFWGRSTNSNHLHQHFIRYLIMFFDYGFTGGIKANDYIRQFMNRHRRFRWPEKKTPINNDQAISLFGKTIEELKSYERTEFIRLFRKRAKELHPDKGGDHEQFVLLVEIYNHLLKK